MAESTWNSQRRAWRNSQAQAVDLTPEGMVTVARMAGIAMPGLAAGGEPGRQPGPEAPRAPDLPGSSIFAAVQPLGLQLDPQILPIETIIVDPWERAPSEN
jgi:uncharacterized protein (TIGR03435 family)